MMSFLIQFWLMSFLVLFGGDEQNYSVSEVTYLSGSARISAVLYSPSHSRKTTALLIVPGNSYTTKDNYRRSAIRFAEKGFTVLCMDKRGCGRSEGNYLLANFDTLALDVIRGIGYLKSLPGVDSNRTGVYALDHAGWIALRAAILSPAVKFVIGVSAPLCTPLQWHGYQFREELLRRKVTADVAEKFYTLHQKIVPYFNLRKDADSILDLFTQYRKQPEFANTYQDDYLRQWISMVGFRDALKPVASLELAPWIRDYDDEPLRALGMIRVPVLLLYGKEDVSWEQTSLPQTSRHEVLKKKHIRVIHLEVPVPDLENEQASHPEPLLDAIAGWMSSSKLSM